MNNFNEYIFEKVKDTPSRLQVGDVPVIEIDELPEGFNLRISTILLF